MMGRLRAAIAAFRGEKRATAEAAARYWPGGVAGYAAVNATAAENLSLVAAAVGVISSAVASLPAYVYRQSDNGRELQPQHPLQRLIDEGPNAHQSWADWVEWFVAQTLLRGNGLSEIVRDGTGAVIALEPLPWEGVSVMQLASGRLAFDAVRLTDTWGSVGAPRRILEGDAVYLKDRSDDGLIGRSRLSRSPAVISAALDVQDAAATALRNHSTPGGMLSADGHIPEDTANRIKDEWESKLTGANRNRVVVGGDGLKYEKFGFSPEDAELLASRRFSSEEVARLYNLPPPLVGIWDNSTFTNSETAGRWFAMFTLVPWCRKIEAEIKRSVFSADERPTHHVELDLSALTRGDYAARWEAHKIAVESDILTRNEVREIEGFNPRAGGDRPTVPPAA